MAEIRIERAWAVLKKDVRTVSPIKEMLAKEVGDGLWIDPFSSEARIAKWMLINDPSSTKNTDYHLDALDFLRLFDSNSVDGVLYSPPYEDGQIRCRKEHMIEIARILKPHGKVICFGWNSNGVGKYRGMLLQRVLIVAHGGDKHDTICTVEVKKGEKHRLKVAKSKIESRKHTGNYTDVTEEDTVAFVESVKTFCSAMEALENETAGE